MDRRELLDDPETSLRLALDGYTSSLWTAMPAIVQKVDFTKMTIEVQPAIQGRVQDVKGVTTLVNLPLLVDVPIVFPSAGGFTLTMPIAIGDEVLVVFAARCIDSWWQSGGIGVPMEQRMHDLSDGFAFLGPKSLPKVVPSISSTKCQLRNNDGDTFLEIDPSGSIKLKATTQIDIEAPIVNVEATTVNVNSDVANITSPTSVTIDSPAVEITGMLTIGGSVDVTGDMNLAGGTLTADNGVFSGVSFISHIHNGVTVGGGSTSGPL